jgi:uncharacterized membrane protein YidH (DUF202 family)
VNTIILVLLIIFAIGLFVVAALAFNHKMDDLSNNEETSVGVVAIFIAILYIIAAVIQFYFFYVVYKGYRYLKDVLLDPMSNLPRLH